MEERMRTPDLDRDEDQEGKTKKKKKRAKAKQKKEKEIVVSRFFPQKRDCIDGSRTERRSKRSRGKPEKKGVVVSRFFPQNLGCIDGSRVERKRKKSHEKRAGFKLSTRCSRRGDHNSLLVVDGKEVSSEMIANTAVVRRFETSEEQKESGASSYFSQNPEVEVDFKLSQCAKDGHGGLVEQPIASAQAKGIESGAKEKAVSRFFRNQDSGEGAVASLNKKFTNFDELLSHFTYKKGSDSSESKPEERTQAPLFLNNKVESDRAGPSKRTRIDSTDTEAPVVEAQKKKKVRSSRKQQLTAAEKKMEAYKRKDGDNTWKPPRSVHRLLQEDHAHDPWRVLVICMLLNITTGRQARRILEKLFSEFPDAKAAADAPEERIQKIIKTLGLQEKRSRMIKRMSQEYLGKEWTHVTQLHGVGKYAADAYAIFCTGRWNEVTPVDHKLRDYWDYLCSNWRQFLSEPTQPVFYPDLLSVK